jgi:hypothetical protein
MRRVFLSFEIGRRILIILGVLFLINGLTILGIRWAASVRSPHLPVVAGPGFLALGLVGISAAYVGLRAKMPWAWIILALAYVPWTLIGLISDTRQSLWLLVIGEVAGLVMIVAALGGTAPEIFRHRFWPRTPAEVLGILLGLIVIGIALVSAGSRVLRPGR